MEKINSNFKDLLKTNKNEFICWPNLVKMNQFTKIINAINNCIRLGLTSENFLNIEYYKKEEPINTFHKTSLNLANIQNLYEIFKSKKTIDEIYNFIYNILDKENYDLKFSDEQIILVLFYDKNEINISLKKEKKTFINEYNYELNEFINKLYNEVLTLKKSLTILSNNIKNKNEESDRLKILVIQNIEIMKKLSEIENENINKQNEINNLKKTITDIRNKNNISKTGSKNYLKKKDIINNYIQMNSNDEADYINANNNQNSYFNYTPNYYNYSYNYYQDYINDVHQNNDDINDYINNYDDYYYDNNNDYYSNNYQNDNNEENDNNEYNENENEINTYNETQDYYNNEIDDYYNYDKDNNVYYNNVEQNIKKNKSIKNKYNKFDIRNDDENNQFNEKPEMSEGNKKLSLKDFNAKYKTNYKEKKIKKLELGSKKLGNIILTEIPKYDFNHIIKLYLCDNDITNINDLIKWSNPNLEKLYFSNNKISDITILSKLNFNKLETLYIDNNLIYDINILSKVNFPLLNKLSLHYNQIKDISVFEYVNFKKLIFLSLHDNKINDIKVFKKVNFPDLDTLYLNNNDINDISCFENINNFQLKQLHLCGNNNINQEKFKDIIVYLTENVSDFEIK